MSTKIVSDEIINKESEKLHQIDIEDPIDSETFRIIDKVLSKLDQIENM